jgi:hypothetical protein
MVTRQRSQEPFTQDLGENVTKTEPVSYSVCGNDRHQLPGRYILVF